MQYVGLAVLGFWLTLAISWVVNFVKLTDCDFKEDYKCEIVHGLGVVPIISLGTVWVRTDKDE